MRFSFFVFCPVVVALSVLSNSLYAQDSREKKLRQGLHDTELVGTWIYDDLNAGFSQAERSRKPLLIVFR